MQWQWQCQAAFLVVQSYSFTCVLCCIVVSFFGFVFHSQIYPRIVLHIIEYYIVHQNIQLLNQKAATNILKAPNRWVSILSGS